jgi:quinol monooxygenase YgiN
LNKEVTKFAVLIVRFRPKVNLAEDFRKHLFEVIEKMQFEDAFVSTIAHVSTDHPDEIILYELWRGTKEDFIAQQLTREYRKRYMDVRDSMLDGFSAEWLEPVNEWGSSLTTTVSK